LTDPIPTTMGVACQQIQTTKVEKGKASQGNLVAWFLGFCIASVPLFSVVLLNWIDDPLSYTTCWCDFFGNIEIFYICVSLSVAAVFNLFLRSERGMIKLVITAILIVDILLSMVLFIVLKGKGYEYMLDHCEGIAAISVVVFLTTLIIGVASFINLKGRV